MLKDISTPLSMTFDYQGTSGLMTKWFYGEIIVVSLPLINSPLLHFGISN